MVERYLDTSAGLCWEFSQGDWGQSMWLPCCWHWLAPAQCQLSLSL